MGRFCVWKTKKWRLEHLQYRFYDGLVKFAVFSPAANNFTNRSAGRSFEEKWAFCLEVAVRLRQAVRSDLFCLKRDSDFLNTLIGLMTLEGFGWGSVFVCFISPLWRFLHSKVLDQHEKLLDTVIRNILLLGKSKFLLTCRRDSL